MPNYDYVINNHFKPFSMQEMLVPLTAYKDAYEKTEEAYLDLADKSDKFKYLSETLPEDSQARQIYEGYANELSRQAEDLARNGLNMGNRRALTGLKRRYAGEIGRLDRADQALQEEMKLRKTMAAKDPSMLYANDNLGIDDFLDNNTPNLYGISGNELYVRGAAAGKSASSRIYSAEDEGSTLNGYYRRWVEKNGYSKESMDAFRANAAAIPELQQAAEDILAEKGVPENLTGVNYERAKQSVLNGIIDGAVYQESVKPVRDEGKMSAAQADASARGWASYNLSKSEFDLKRQAWEDDRNMRYIFQKDENGNVVRDDNGYPIIVGLNPEYVSNKDKTPEQKAIEDQRKNDYKDMLNNAQKVKGARTLKEIDKAGYTPVFATVHPSHGTDKGLNVEDAIKQKKYENVEGWRSGPSGTDVPDLYIDWTSAPLVKGSNAGFMPDLVQFSSGSVSSPNNGDFAYGESELKGMQTKVLSDDEYAKLPPAVLTSISAELQRQGYGDGTPFEVMEVVGKNGKKSYVTLVPKNLEILGE